MLFLLKNAIQTGGFVEIIAKIIVFEILFCRLFFEGLNCDSDGIYFAKKHQDAYRIATVLHEKCVNIFDDYFLKQYIHEGDLDYALNDLFVAFEERVQCESHSKSMKPRSKRLCVLLHGWGANSALYHSLIEDISGRFDLIVAPDLFGFGNSPDPNGAWGMDEFVRVLMRLCFLFDFDEICLVGHSFGGKTILFLMQSHELFKRLCLSAKVSPKIVLIAPSGQKPKFSISKFIKIWKYKRFKKKCKSNPALIEKCNKFGSDDLKSIKSENLKKTFLRVVNTHLVDREIQDLGSKVLLIFGEKDGDVPVNLGKRIQKRLPHCLFAVIKGAGHYCFLDSRFEVKDLILKFLN